MGSSFRRATVFLSFSTIVLLGLYNLQLISARDERIRNLETELLAQKETIKDLQSFAKRCVREELNKAGAAKK